MNEFTDRLKEYFGENRPILLGEILQACSDVTEDANYRRIRKAVADGNLAKQGPGVYYIPTQTLFGPSVISEDAVIAKKYLTDGSEVYGYVTGLALENKAGVSPQVPGVLEIVTNKETTRARRIGRRGGYREVILRKPRIPVSTNNVDALEALDLLTAVPLASLDTDEREKLKRKVSKVGRDKLMRYIEYYPAKTAKRLLESERLGVFT